MLTHPLRPSPIVKRIYGFLAILLLTLSAFISEVIQFGLIPIAILMCCAIFMIATYFYYRVVSRAKQQALNSALAYTSLADESFFLYLRSFKTSGKIPVRNSIRFWFERAITGTFWDIEHSLSIALDSLGLLVAIGDRKKSIGAAKLLPSNDDWRSRFLALAPKARAIFIVPDSSASVVWEISHVRSTPALLEKTWFLMPPCYWRGTVYALFLFPPIFLLLLPMNLVLRARAQRRWKAIRASLLAEGINLPGFNRSGCIFQIGSDGAVDVRAFNDLRSDYVSLLLTDPPAAVTFSYRKAWFDRFPISWTFLAPSAVGMLLLFLSIILPFLVVARIFVYQPFFIPSSSMQPTVLVGDYVIVDKRAYGYSRYSFPGGLAKFSGRIDARTPDRGDIVVFKLPRDNSTDFVKRIVGLPGDEIQMRGGVLHINGAPVPKRRIGEFRSVASDGVATRVPLYEETLPNNVIYRVLDSEANGTADNTELYKVPSDHYFMLGDNRDNSLDSRMASLRFGVGYVPFENLIGKAEFVYFSVPINDPDVFLWSRPWTWPKEVRWSRMFARLHSNVGPIWGAAPR